MLLVVVGLAWSSRTMISDAEAGTDLDMQRFQPAIHSFGQFRAESAKVSTGIAPGVFLMFNHAGGPYQDDSRPNLGLESLSTMNLVSSIGFLNHFSFGFDLPLHVQRSGFPPSAGGALTGFSLGDLRLSVKGSFTKPRIRKLGAALGVDVGVATGKDNLYTDEAGTYIDAKLLLEGRATRVRMLYNLVYRHRTADLSNGFFNTSPYPFTSPQGIHNVTTDDAVKNPNDLFKHEIRSVLGIGVLPDTGDDMVEICLETSLATSLIRPFDDDATYLEQSVGVKFNHPNGFMIGLGGGVGLAGDLGTPKYRVFASLGYQPQDYLPEDVDKDGLLDHEDACPLEPEDVDNFEDLDGCPDFDNDGDGIEDAEDKCPLEPEDLDGIADEDGCPDGDRDGDGIDDPIDGCPDDPEDIDGVRDQDGCPDPDTDGDGIDDVLDKCPSEAEDRDGYQDEDGCPDLDNDSDGIPDAKDRCPNDAEDLDGVNDDDGCPEQDSDGDGVPDAIDQCPDEPENINGCEDNDGCPEAKRVCVSSERIVISEKIFFATNRAEILKRSFGLLEEVAQVILNHPEIAMLEIQGHTDSRGSDKHNMNLSQRRAEAVYTHMVRLGIPRERLGFQGYGESMPVADNESSEGRAQNRRVEFIIKQQASGGE
jgi:outer membrane protein OmpA-like peptidoglycan-associated protein